MTVDAGSGGTSGRGNRSGARKPATASEAPFARLLPYAWLGPLLAAAVLVAATWSMHQVVTWPETAATAKPAADAANPAAVPDSLEAAVKALNEAVEALKKTASKLAAGAPAAKPLLRDEIPRFSFYLWGSAAMMFITVALAAVFVLFVNVAPLIFQREHWKAALLAAALIVAMPLLPNSPFAFGRYEMAGDMGTTISSVPYVRYVVSFMWGMTLIAAFFVLAGAATSALQDPDKIDKESLGQAVKRLQVVLFSGAAVLAAGVIEVEALYQWAAMKQAYSADAQKVMIPSAVVPVGTFFSLFLAAAYIPAALVLRHCGDRLAHKTNPNDGPAKRMKWLQDEVVNVSIQAQIAALLALFTPALLAAGPLRAVGSAFG